MKRSAVARSNASTTTPGARVAIAGGTQGIGESIAYRFAKAGAEVWIVGRNESKAKAVLENLKLISHEHNVLDPPPVHRYIRADLSLISEARRVAEDIRIRAGSKGVDYLILSQGGPPNGKFVATTESHDQHYAVQVLSRFILAYLLALHPDPASSVVKQSIMSIMAPGGTMPITDYDDLELLKAKERGKHSRHAVLSRDSNVVDIFTEEIAERNPNINMTHVFPGIVKTDVLKNSPPPWYLSGLMAIGMALLGGAPESYAEVPFYFLANPVGRAACAKAPFWSQHICQLKSHPSSQDKANRAKVWTHLLEMLNSGK